ncbi:hypothetical protein NPIL_60391, partial [Nephila pilipes]
EILTKELSHPVKSIDLEGFPLGDHELFLANVDEHHPAGTKHWALNPLTKDELSVEACPGRCHY